MKIWSNTKTLDGLVDDLMFTDNKGEANIALIGGKSLELDYFPTLKGIFKCGVGRDNVPETEAATRGIRCGFPSTATADIIFEETACFACHLILKCLYADIGDFRAWTKLDRTALCDRKILILGTGNIGSKVAKKIHAFAEVLTFDVLTNQPDELEPLIREADCISLHMPLNDGTRGWFDAEKLAWMKSGSSLVNTARAAIVPEDALYEELATGRIRAAFDVFWQEPYQGRLLTLPQERFMASPHVASTCREFVTETANDFRTFVESLEQSDT
jgi:phosphoglycerate dehydrogenase-like enzyme